MRISELLLPEAVNPMRPETDTHPNADAGSAEQGWLNLMIAIDTLNEGGTKHWEETEGKNKQGVKLVDAVQKEGIKFSKNMAEHWMIDIFGSFEVTHPKYTEPKGMNTPAGEKLAAFLSKLSGADDYMNESLTEGHTIDGLAKGKELFGQKFYTHGFLDKKAQDLIADKMQGRFAIIVGTSRTTDDITDRGAALTVDLGPSGHGFDDKASAQEYLKQLKKQNNAHRRTVVKNNKAGTTWKQGGMGVNSSKLFLDWDYKVVKTEDIEAGLEAMKKLHGGFKYQYTGFTHTLHYGNGQ